MAIIMNPMYDTRGSDEERRCFDFFLNRTASQLSGFWDSEFWGCLILRATHHHPAIRHAVLALGSLHERFEAGDRSVMSPIWDKGEGGFALKQYNQAIQHLIKPVSERQQAVDVCLVACLLFACFEVSPFLSLHRIFKEERDAEWNCASVKYRLTSPKTMRAHHGLALSHIQSGVKILSEVEFNSDGDQFHSVLTTSRHPFVDFQELEIKFNRLDSQAAQVRACSVSLSPSSSTPSPYG